MEIHVEPGSDIEKIIESIRKSEGVKEACRVVGRSDILVTVEGGDLRQISDIALQRISAVRGVSIGNTLVCIDSERIQNPTNNVVPSRLTEEIPAISFS